MVFTMSNVFDYETAPQLESLVQKVGSIEECGRLGFVTNREDGIWHLSAVGLGYLLYLAKIDSEGSPAMAQAFAAGFECATDNAA